MRILSKTGTEHIIDYYSDKEYTQLNYPDYCFEKLKDIKHQIILDFETLDLIVALNLTYLLFNNEHIYIDIDIDIDNATYKTLQEVEQIRSITYYPHKFPLILKYLNYSPYYQSDRLNLNMLYEYCGEEYPDSVKIFDWVFKNTSIIIEFKSCFMGSLFENGAIDILKWIDVNNIKFTIDQPNFYKLCLHECVYENNYEIMKWYAEHVKHVDCNEWPVDIVENICIVGKSRRIDILENILELSIKYKMKFKYNLGAIRYICRKGYVEVLEWFKKHKFNIDINDKLIHTTFDHTQYKILDWMQINNVQIVCTEDIIYALCTNDDVYGLDWLIRNNMPIIYSKHKINEYLCDSSNAMRWFIEHDFKFDINNDTLDIIRNKKDVELLHLLMNKGYIN